MPDALFRRRAAAPPVYPWRTRPFAAGPCTVAVLHSDGIESSLSCPGGHPLLTAGLTRSAAPVDGTVSRVPVAEGNEARLFYAALEECRLKVVSTPGVVRYRVAGIGHGFPAALEAVQCSSSAAYAVGPDGPVGDPDNASRSGKGTFAYRKYRCEIIVQKCPGLYYRRCITGSEREALDPVLHCRKRFARYVLDACITDVAARHPGNKSISGL